MLSRRDPRRRTRVGRRRALRGAGVVLILLLAACDGYQNKNMGSNDYVANYDTNGKHRDYAKTDWPVNFIFYGPGAEVDRVKDILDAAGATHAGGFMNLWLRDYSGSALYDEDRGRKYRIEDVGCGTTWLHMRLYADGNDRMSNSTFENYVVGTSHEDWREGCSNEMFGWSELVEQLWADKIWCRGYNFAQDHAMNNYEAFRTVRDNHVWWSDGWARKVYVPELPPAVRC